MSDAREMIEMLRRHYLPEGREPGGIFAPEIQAPGSTRRADLIWQGCTAAGGHELVGHEVKVTRADLLNELADPAKSDPWQRYCDRWWLVLPDASLMDGLDLPPSWGVLTPPSGRRTRSMTITAPAPTLNPVEQAPALKTIAVWLHWRLHRAEFAQQRTAEDLRILRETNDKLHRDLRASGRQPTAVERVVAEVIQGLGFYDGDIGGWEQRVSVEDVVMALKDFGATRAKAEEAHRMVKLMRSTLESARRRAGEVLANLSTEP